MKIYRGILLIVLQFCLIQAETKQNKNNAKTFSSEAGFYKAADSSNSCSNDDLNALSVCTSEILSSLDNCKPNDLNCVCCSLQNLDNGCFDLCSDYTSNNILSSITKDCEPLSDIDTCEAYSKTKNTPLKKILTPKKKLIEEEQPKTIVKSVFNNKKEKLSSKESQEVTSNFKNETTSPSKKPDNQSIGQFTKNTEKKSGSKGLFISFKSLCFAISIILISII
ncbi:uncharacterized protein HGUI_01349 [Hanseniaspora guilliermondii]|uniref:Extracellular membrane protein CFEM domain-containing protein n=1 Tax=Hanseniaspora guilliermondii TaxID=56406 RepID=A0A1L0CK02_9ASCO|nr:uncharacterized protein HGUI_01349 [Hanseniaspora guilliermondii]